ncbi:MAG: hypothetical protein U1E93_06055 [Alphaproteobacteria bacterium]
MRISAAPSPRARSAADTKLPTGGTVFISVREADKDYDRGPARELLAMGFSLIATRGTATLGQEGLKVAVINKVLEGRPHVVDALKNGEINLVFNTTDGAQALADSSSIRRAARRFRITRPWQGRRPPPRPLRLCNAKQS